MQPTNRNSLNHFNLRAIPVANALLVVLVGCQGDLEDRQMQSSLRPKDYVSAVVRLQHLHDEILSKPLAARVVHVTQDSHRHAHDDKDHHHGHGHDQHGHGHGHDHEHGHNHVRLDALDEMREYTKWIPKLAADTALEETPWNQVNASATELMSLLRSCASDDPAQRQEAYRKQVSHIESQLSRLNGAVEIIRAEYGAELAHQ